MVTEMRKKRALFFKESGVFSGKFLPPLKRMTEEVLCPCHSERMVIVVSDGQALNLRKECARQRKLNSNQT